MRRAFGYAGAWLAATAAAVTLSWLGCAIVLNRSPLTPSSGLTRVPAHPTELSEPAVAATMQPVQTAPAVPAPARTTAPHASRSSRPTVPSGTPTYTRHGTPPPRRHRTTPGTHHSTPEVLPATPSPTAGGEAEQATYRVTGGEATLRFTEDQVLVASVDPAAGYQWMVDRSRPGDLVVIFFQAHQESDLHVAWNGEPGATVTEYWW